MGHKQKRKASRREWLKMQGKKHRKRCFTCTLSCEVIREYEEPGGYYNYNTCPFKEDNK